jgi:predicted CoA-binding protein
VVVTVVPPAEALRVVEEAARLGLTKVWLQQGSASPEAVALAKERGLELVADACVLMHLKPTGFHAVHGWLARALGSGVTTTTSGSSGRG